MLWTGKEIKQGFCFVLLFLLLMKGKVTTVFKASICIRICVANWGPLRVIYVKSLATCALNALFPFFPSSHGQLEDSFYLLHQIKIKFKCWMQINFLATILVHHSLVVCSSCMKHLYQAEQLFCYKPVREENAFFGSASQRDRNIWKVCYAPVWNGSCSTSCKEWWAETFLIIIIF